MQWRAAQDQMGRDLQRSLPENPARVQICRVSRTSGFARLEIVNDPQFGRSPCLQKSMDLNLENFCRHAQARSVQSSCIAGVQRPDWRGPCGFSSLAGPFRSLNRNLCIITHVKNHHSPQLLINADRSCVRFCHLDSDTVSLQALQGHSRGHACDAVCNQDRNHSSSYTGNAFHAHNSNCNMATSLLQNPQLASFVSHHLCSAMCLLHAGLFFSIKQPLILLVVGIR